MFPRLLLSGLAVLLGCTLTTAALGAQPAPVPARASSLTARYPFLDERQPWRVGDLLRVRPEDKPALLRFYQRQETLEQRLRVSWALTIIGGSIVVRLLTNAVTTGFRGRTLTSSMGLRVLMLTSKALAKHGGRCLLMRPQLPVRRVIEIANALPTQAIFVNDEEADRYLDRIQQEAREEDGGGEVPPPTS
jgi:hypothetical protein